jgi:peptidoglycan/LPS O-acetylase OafA/YrhL
MLGDISYSLYLMNFPVLLVADLLWPRIEPMLAWLPDTTRRLVWMVLLLLVIIGISRLTFRWIEGPLRDRTKALLGGRRPCDRGRAGVDPLIPAADPAP